MTNWDKYKEDIEQIIKTGYNFKVTEGNTIGKCYICDDCKFANSNSCNESREKWLNSVILNFDYVYEEFTNFCKSNTNCDECKYNMGNCDSRFIFDYSIEHKDLLG